MMFRSHFLLSVFSYYYVKKIIDNVFIVLMLYCKTILLLFSWVTGKIRDGLVVRVGLMVG